MLDDPKRQFGPFVAVLIFGVVCVAVGIMQGRGTGYNRGYFDGRRGGYSEGYNEGEDEGFRVGVHDATLWLNGGSENPQLERAGKFINQQFNITVNGDDDEDEDEED